MKSLIAMLLGAGLLAIQVGASAEPIQQISRSAGKIMADQSVDLSAVLEQLEPVVKLKSDLAEDYASSPQKSARDAGVANRHDQLFEIYQANVFPSGDLDADGYYHALNVNFDADVNYDSATVYAKLYLSRNGGPWGHYFTTRLFQIHGNDTADAYEVETELMDGYEPGHYAVLIEIYSLDHAYMVASEVLDYHYLGRPLPLEDQYWDDPVGRYYGEVSVSYGASADLSALLILLLIVQVAIAARGLLALTPCKKSESKLEE